MRQGGRVIHGCKTEENDKILLACVAVEARQVIFRHCGRLAL